MRRAGQAGQARERALDALLGRIEIPLPERVIDQEIEQRRQSLAERLDRSGTTLEAYLEATGKTAEDLETDLAQDARQSIKAGFILDKLAGQEEIGVAESDLSDYITEQAYRLGVPPDRLARQLTDAGQLSSVVADVLRSKALSLIAERARVTDESGREIDLSAVTAADAADQEPPQTLAEGESAAASTEENTAEITAESADQGTAAQQSG